MGLLWIAWLVQKASEEVTFELRKWAAWPSGRGQVQRRMSMECLRNGTRLRGARKWKWNQRSHDVWPPRPWQEIRIYSSMRKATGGFWAEEWHEPIVFKDHANVIHVKNWLHLNLGSDSRALNPYTKECNWGMMAAIWEGSTEGEITSVWAFQGNLSGTWLWTVPVT